MALEQKILDELARKPWQLARELALTLNVDRSNVNTALHGSLKPRVVQNSAYQWALANAAVSGQQPNAAAAIDTPLARLCRYYLDCINEGDNDGVSVYATSFNQPDYAELNGIPGGLNPETSPLSEPGPARIVARCSGPRSDSVLRIGFPTLVVERTSQNGKNFYMVEPILVWTPELADIREAGIAALQTDIPSLNVKAIQSLTGSRDSTALHELLHLMQELGLDQPQDDAPEVEELVLRLRSLRPDWPWQEETTVRQPGTTPGISGFQGTGILNRAIVLATERSPYTRGLESELNKMAHNAEALTQQSALANWVLGRMQSSSMPSNETLLEVVPLNSEQRMAVQMAISQPLTVITGPPGTGKSQVVTSILINAAWHKKRVLFASKNNKAVDVVEVRMNALGTRPFLLRLGSTEYNDKLKDYLTRLLGTTATPEDKRNFDEARKGIEKAESTLRDLTAESMAVLDLRNKVDILEQGADEGRQVLGDGVFTACRTLDVEGQRLAAYKLSAALNSIDRNLLGFWSRLFWTLTKEKRTSDAATLAENVRPLPKLLGFSLPEGYPKPTTLGEWRHALANWNQRIEHANRAQKYSLALKALSTRKPLESLHAEISSLQESLGQLSQTLWETWLRLQPSHLKPDQRRLLREYLNVLQLVANTQGDGGRITNELWKQFSKLSAQVVTILPCWAITSLSAKGRLPLKPELFDLVVIDEASQCDIASALPLLYRAKAAVIIGDPMQLRHISALTRVQDQQLLSRHKLVEDHLGWSYSVTSLFDLASGLCRSEDIVQLRDHHRSHPDIIGFSNKEFYEGRLRVATKLRQLRPLETQGPTIRWIHVAGETKRPGGSSLLNENEAKRVVEELGRIILHQGYPGTIGIISPFRAQVSLIRDPVSQNAQFAPVLDRTDFLADTVHRFQGDERDVIIFSPTISRGSIDRAAGFLRSTPNLFNVAVTRARAALIVIGDASAAQQAGVDYLSRFANYVSGLGKRSIDPVMPEDDLGPEYPPVHNPRQVSEWERVLYRALYQAGIRTIPQYTEEKYILDLAMLIGERRLDIEVDGERYNRARDGELCRRDQLRSLRLIDLGWDVMRFWVYQVRDDLGGCVAHVRQWIAQDSRKR